MSDRLAYTVNEAAAALGVSRDVIYTAINAGQLPDVKIGSRRLVPAADLAALLQQDRQP